jgi:hypothetical protein
MGSNSKELSFLQLRRCKLCMRTHYLSGPNMQQIKEANGTVVRNVCTLAHTARVLPYPHTWIRPYLLL